MSFGTEVSDAFICSKRKGRGWGERERWCRERVWGESESNEDGCAPCLVRFSE